MSDRTISRLQAKITREERLIYEAGLRDALSTRQGRAYIWHLLGHTGLFSNPHRSNALDTAFACGAQNIGQIVLTEIDSVAPDAYITMMKESQENARSNAARLANADRADPSDSDFGADDSDD